MRSSCLPTCQEASRHACCPEVDKDEAVLDGLLVGAHGQQMRTTCFKPPPKFLAVKTCASASSSRQSDQRQLAPRYRLYVQYTWGGGAWWKAEG
jgi:hypothetical protein